MPLPAFRFLHGFWQWLVERKTRPRRRKPIASGPLSAEQLGECLRILPRRRAPLPSVEVLENRVAPAVTASVVSNVLVVQGDSGNNTIKIHLDSDTSKLDVLDNNSAVTGSPFTIATFSSVSVLAGSGNDTIEIASLTANATMAAMTVTLAGEAGSDTYQFDDNWGTIVINDTGGTLDFYPQFTGTLTLNAPSSTAGQHEIVGANGAVTSTIDYDPAATFTTDISGPANKANLQAGLTAIADLGDRLETVNKLAQSLPLLDGQSLGQLIDIGGTLKARLVDSISALPSNANLDTVLAAFNAVGGLSASASRASSGDVTFNFTLDVQAIVSNVFLTLPDEISQKLQVDALFGDLNTRLQWSVQVLQTSGGTFSATSTSNLLVSADLDKNGFNGRAGFLGLNFGSPSTVFLNADVTVNTSSISGSTTAQLNALSAGGLAQTGTALAKVDLTGSTTVDGISITFPSLPAPHISLTGTSTGSTYDLFNANATQTYADNFTAAGLDDFYLTNAGSVRAQLLSFADFLDLFSSSALKTALPLSASGTTLADVLDLKNQFTTNFLSLLERPALTTNTLVSTLNGGRGVRTAAGDDIRITLSNNVTFTVDFNTSATSATLSAGTMLGDLINKIQAKANGTAGITAANFEVRIDPRTGGLAIVDRTGGSATTFAVTALNGSLAGADLDLLSPGAAQFDEQTLARDLNNGLGVRTVAGNDIRITLADSTTFDVDLDHTASATIDDLITLIRNASPNLTNQQLDIALDKTNNRLILTDKTGGSSIPAVVTAINGSLALGDLKINAASGSIAAPKIIAQNINFPGPNFGSVQEMAANAGGQITSLSYSNTTHRLSFTADVNVGQLDSTTLALLNTGPLQNLAITNGPINVSLTPTGTTKLHLPFEVLLTDIGSGFDLGSGTTSATLLKDLNRGVGVRTVAGADIHVQLSDNTKSFDVDLNNDVSSKPLSGLSLTTGAGNDITVVLKDGSTFGVDLDPIGTKTIGDLVTALNDAAATAFGDGQEKFLAEVSVGRGSLILIDSTTGAGTYQVTAPANLGLGAPVTAYLDGDPQLFVEASYRTLGDVMQQIQQAATAAGLTSTQFEVRIAPDGKGLRLIDGANGSGAFTVTDLNNSLAWRDLGLAVDGILQPLALSTALGELNRGTGVSTVAGNDLRITLRDGSTFDVNLSAAQTTIGDVLNAIQAAADSAFGANQTKFKTGLDGAASTPSLFDLTSGASTFAVTALNSSPARDDLGLTASGVNGNMSDGTAAQVISITSKTQFIEGVALHGDTSSAHFGVRGATLTSTVNLAASNINANGTWGPVAIAIAAGSATGAYSFNMTFADIGSDALDGMASLRELRRGLPTPDQLMTSVTHSGTLQLNLPVTIAPPFGGLTNTAPLVINVADVTDDSTPPALSFTGSNATMDFLNKVGTLTIADAIAALHNTADYLKSLETAATIGGQTNPLAQPVPGLNRSLGQLLEFGSTFDTLLAAFDTNAPQTLQALQSALDALTGISGVTLGFDSTAGSEALQVNFVYSLAQVLQQRFQLNLPGTAASLAALGLSSASTILDADKVSPVSVTAGSTINIGLGVNLTSNHDAFLYGPATTMALTLRALQNDLNFEALFGARTVSIVGGTYVFDTDGSGPSTSPAAYAVSMGAGRHTFANALTDTTATLTGKINTNLPVKYAAEFNQPLNSAITLSVDYPPAAGTPTLTATGPNIDTTLNSKPLNGNIQGIRAGFKELFRLLDLAFDASVFAKPLPFVGNQLISAADFLEQMRDKVGDNFDFITGIMTPAKAQQAIFDAFGPGGLNWLQDRTNDTDNVVNVNDIVITNSANAVGFALTLTMPATSLDVPVDVDFALPGLGLKLDAQANVQFGFTMPLSFGISTAQGVYVDDSSFDNMTATLTASLPTPPDPSGFKGWLGTMPYRITEQSNTTTQLAGNIDVTIHDPNSDGKLSLNELTASLGAAIRATDASTEAAANALISGGFSSTSNGVHLHLTSDLPTGAVVPRYQMDLDISNWNYVNGVPSTPTIAFDHVQFELVSFIRDFVGSSLTRLRTAFKPVDGVVDFMNNESFPFLSLIFGRAPYVSANTFDGGKVEIGNFAGASLAIRRIVEGGTLVGTATNPFGTFGVVPPGIMPSSPPSSLTDVGPIAGLTGEQWINIGDPVLIDFTIDGAQALQPLPAGTVSLVPQNMHARSFGNPDDNDGASILGDIRAVAGNTSVAGGVQDAALDFLAIQLLPGRGKVEGFFGGGIRFLLGVGIDPVQLPILTDATKSFSLLFGDYKLGDASAQAKDTNLLKYGTPEMFLYLYQDIPISKEQLAKKILQEGTLLGPLTTFGIRVEAFIPVAFETRADLGVAIDTTGLKTFGQTHNPADLVNGFYFDDHDGIEKNGPNTAKIVGSNSDPDEMKMLGGAGIGVQIIFDASIIQLKIGVEAIAFLGSAWNLHDPDNSDGLNRVRASEFDANSGKSIYDQSFVVEIRADVFAKLSVGISIFRVTIIDIRFNLATDTFDIPFIGQSFNSPVSIGSMSGGQLTLDFSAGTNPNKVFYVGKGDADGDVVVSTVVTVNALTYDRSQVFTGVTSIIGTAGAGNDEVYVSAAVTTPVTIHGGAGNDILVGGSGDDHLYGDAGNDTISGGGGNDTLEGGADDDTIHGDDGNDTIRGDDGVDTLYGDRGDDAIYGGLGVAIIFGGAGADLLVGDTSDDTIRGGPGNDRIRGGQGRDHLYGDDGADTIDGEEGDDEIHGGLGNDVINGGAGDDLLLGEQNNDTITGGIGNDRIDGGGASDRIYGDMGPPNPEPSGDDVIISQDGNDFLDGQGGSDTYLIDFQGGNANSLITVLDTGSNEGTDLFTVTGTVNADNFLLRSNAGGTLSFVALVNSSTAVERINYTGVERIVINGGIGNDNFAVDDTTAEVTINGDDGADTFQVGQLYASERTSADANVSVDDEFATLETTRGFLSNGNSEPMTINGGNGDDHFVVFHNKAELSLNGDAGDDFFEVRAFALVGSQEPQRARTDISGGAGADLVQYAVNAPVNVDGGDGFDTVVAIGTEFGDDFVITKDGVFGGGLNVSYVNIESLRVDGAEGDDRFYVQSTNPNVATELLGGLGNDTFNMSGDIPPVVSNDLRGHTGIVTHDIESLDPLYDGTKVAGIAAHVADNDEPGVVIQPTGGSTIITEGGVADSYQVVLTRMPTVTIIVKALAPLPTPDERERHALAFAVSSNAPDAINAANGTYVSLKFTPANWFIPQTVFVKADATVYSDPAGLLTRPELGDSPNFTFDDNANEGISYGVINHIILADLPSFSGTLAMSQLTSVTAATAAVLEVTGSAVTGNNFNLTVGANAPMTCTVGADTSAAAILDGLKAAFDAAKSAQGAGGSLENVNALRMTQRTISLSGSVDASDQFTATFGTQTITYTIPDTGVSTLAQAADGLATAINAANITGVTADSRAANGTIVVRAPAATTFTVAELTDPGNNSGIALSGPTQLLVVDAEDGDLTTDNSTNFSVSTNSVGAAIVIDVDGSSGATTQFADSKDLSDALIGRKIEVTSGPGAGQQRFVVGISGSVVTVDRPWNIDDVPTFQSTYLIRQDDAIVGKPTSVDNTNFTFTDTAHSTPFPTAGEGLRGRVLSIVGGPGAGQERLILSNTASTLTLNGAWRTAPTSASIYRIDMYDGLAVPSVRVQVNDNDKPGIIVDETKGYENGVVNDSDTVTAVIEGGDGNHLGEQDVVQVRLTTNPGATPVDVTLNYDGAALALTALDGTPIPGNKLTFNSGNWNTVQTIRVAAVNNTIREGFHSSLIKFNITAGSADTTSPTQTDTFTIPADRSVNSVGLTHDPSGAVTVTLDGNAVQTTTANPAGLGYELIGNEIVFHQGTDYTNVSGTIVVSYNYLVDGYLGALTPSVLVQMNDDDAPTAVIRETGGSTDVIESGSLPNVALERLSQGWYTGSIGVLGERDSYSVLLIAGKTYTFEMRGAPTSDGTLPDPYLRLFTSDNLVTPVEFDDDSGVGTNSLLTYTPTTSGYFVLQGAAWSDSSTGTYVLSMLPGYTTGSIAFNGERDRYELSLVAGKTYTFEMLGTPTGDGTLTDPYLRLYNTTAPNTVIAQDDDSGAGFNSRLVFTPSADGLYIIEAAGWADIRSGSYTISWTDQSSGLSQADVQKLQNANDSYDVVLTKSPAAGQTVTITVTPEITKTTRTGGIRHDAVQVALSSSDGRVVANPDGTLSVTFNDQNWDAPVSINVTAIDDNFVDGGDTKVFAPGPHTVSGILGPVSVDGGGGQGSLVGIPAPVKLPGETNVKPKTGDVVSVTGTQAIVLNADLTAAFGAAPLSDLLGKTLQVTAVTPATNTTHSAIGQFRQIIQVTDNGNGTVTFTLNQSFDYNLNGNTGESDADIRSYAITQESPNFFVNEATQVDYMFVHDEDSPADSSGTLTANRITGLNMGPDITIGGQRYVPGGITYGNLEVLQIDLGKGFNNFNVLGTGTRTDGYQTWTLLNTGDDVADPNHPLTRVGDTVSVKLNATAVSLPIANVTSATDATPSAFATLSDSAAAFPTTGGGLAGQIVEIISGPGAGQVRRILSNTATTLYLDSKWGALPDSTSTYQITKKADGKLAVNLQGGDDVLDASASTLGIVVFGGLGADTITGGSGDDIIFGDRGRVDYFNQAGAIVTRLGDAPPPITGAVTTQVTASALMTLTDSAASFPLPDDVVDALGSDDIGLRGLYVSINNGAGFLQKPQLITDNTLHSLTLSPGFDTSIDLPGPGGASTYRISTYPENQTDGVVRDPGLLVTVDNNLGSADTIDAGAGNDEIFGGAGADTLTGGDDNDVIVGDAGRYDRSRDPSALSDVFTAGLPTPIVPTLHDHLRTTDSTFGGADIINAGQGDDVILGGFGGDTIDADVGNNLILGDDGQIDYSSADGDASDIDKIESLSTTANGGVDTITAGSGNDIVIGGRFGDSINVGDGDNLVIGDSGRITAANANSPHQLAGQPITLGLIETIAFTDGGIDTITTGTGNDIVLGGMDGDTIDANTGNNLVLGDDGQIDYTRADRATTPGADTDASDIDLIESLSTTAGGGVDTITTLGGNDIVIGGRFGDSINVGDGDNLVIGDSGRITAANANSPHQLAGQPITLSLIETIAFTDGGIDTITTGTGNDIVLGGMDGDTIDANTGNNLVLGDDGQIDYSRADRTTTPGADTDASDIDLIESLSTTAGGGVDTITTLGGNDIVLGGRFGDSINVGDGDNLVIGDSGRITAANANSPQLAGQSITLGLIETIAFTDGGIDTITTGTGNDIVLGGMDGDTIDANTGNNLVLGDDGQIDYTRADRATTPGADTDASDIDLIESLSTTAGGGVDTITTLGGNDIVLGGRFGDSINVGDGDNFVIGDSGRVTAANANSPHQLAGQPITLGLIETIAFTDGGIDTITTGTGNDIVLGGMDGDTIDAYTGNNLILGDDGQIDYSRADRNTTPGADADASDIDLIESLSTMAGGGDTITTLGGNDIVLGGGFGDSINVGDGDNLVIGDSGRITAANASSPHQLAGQPITLGLIETIAFTDGGVDTITTGTGNDIILGGMDGDTIDANTGNNLILGDDGQIDYSRADRNTTPGADADASDIDLIESLSTMAGGGVDTITTLGGNDIVLGGRFGDSIDVGDGDNLVIGDSGRITAANANSPHQLAGQPITLGLIETIAFTDGGIDTITTGTGNDIVLGGMAGDTIDASSGNNLVLGDDGQIDYSRADRGAGLGADTNASDIDLIESISTTAGGGSDTITTLDGRDIIFGGRSGDLLNAGDGDNLVVGDSGRFTGDLLVGQPITLGVIETIQHDDGGVDIVNTGIGADTVLGGFAGDTITLGAGDDIAIGDNGQVVYAATNAIQTTDLVTTTGGDDLIQGNDGNDIILGGVGNDMIDGQVGQDLILGDNGLLQSRPAGVVTDPRIRALTGTKLYDGAGQVLVDRTAQFADPNNTAAWANWVITLDDGGTGLFGNDYLAGGPQNDKIFGQRGNDTIQGDGSIASALLATPAPVGAFRDANGLLVVSPSVEAATDGDDYIEGGGENDVVFGNLGQDDIIGGNSNQYGLTQHSQRGDGADLLFGGAGAGTDLARNDTGDTSANGHARDADAIVGDNGNIFRIVGTNRVNSGDLLAFTYDNYNTGAGTANKIVPRAVELIDYTPGSDLAGLVNDDIGAADEIHGESGDDFIYGQKGNDVLFGEGQDDDLVGGRGADWISGGTGDDGILGDDGRISTSRNGQSESLNGVVAIPANQLNLILSTSSRQNESTINVSGRLKKTADLEPFQYGGNDILYGGLGNDSIHGGAGDDAISGAEALPNFFEVAINPGNVLRFGAVRAGEFAAYNYVSPRTKIANFLLNFEASVAGVKVNDGQDVLFGDDGNDWLVGGTNSDHLYGGVGNDLLNSDDNLDSNSGLNDTNELGLYGDADLAYGGGGKDVLIANTTFDRLIDWNLNASIFIVPFNNVTAPTVTSTIEASLYLFLYGVSGSDGTDPTRPGDPSRHGEPNGELGLFTPADASYGSQTSLPANGTSTLNNPVTFTGIGDVSTADTVVQADVIVGTGQQAGLIARFGTDGHYYLGQIRSTGSGFVAEIYLFDGTTHLLASAPVNSGTGLLRFELAGSFLRLLYGPDASSLTQVVFTYNSALSGPGTLGIRASQSAGVDNFVTSPVTVPTSQTLPFSDAFNANPPTQILSSNWLVRTGAFSVASNALVSTTALSIANVHGIALANASVRADVVVNTVSGANAGVIARVNSKGQYYWARIVRSGTAYFAQIYRVAGTPTLLASVKVASGTGTLQFDVMGASLKLLYGPDAANLALVAYAFDKVLTTGSTGVRLSKNASMDNFVTATINVAATQPLPFGDAFNASPPTQQLSAAWQERQGNFTVVGDNLAGRAAVNFATVNGIALANVAVQADVNLASKQSAGLIARYQTNGIYCLAQLSNTGTARTANIYKFVPGVGLVRVNTVVGTFAGNGGAVTFEVAGSSLKLFVNGNLVAYAFDASIAAAGLVGVRASANATLDNFGADQITPNVPALPFTDDFAAPLNGNQLARAWQERLGNFAISSGALANAPGATLSLASVNSAALGNTASEIAVTLPNTGTSLVGLVARYQGTGDRNLYLGAIRIVNGVATAVIMKNVGGKWTQLASHSVASGVGKLRFEVIGTALNLYFGPAAGPLTLVASATDTTFAAGLNGIRLAGNGAVADYLLEAI